MGNTANASHTLQDSQEEFLIAHKFETALRTPMLGDFSSRHYIRLSKVSRKALLMVMPDPKELKPFLSMHAALDMRNIRVPAIYATDQEKGYALIEDLGDRDFGSILRGTLQKDYFYAIAVDALLVLHRSSHPISDHLPRYAPELFLQQVGLFLKLYGEYVLKKPFSQNAQNDFQQAWLPALQQACAIPQSIMLRDYHAANIMYLEHESKHRKAAMIDFQDGGVGPISYDLASLLEDARLDVPELLRSHMLEIYMGTSELDDRSAFMTSYHVLAVQRHMRVLGILAKRWASGAPEVTGDYFRRVWGLLMLHQPELLLKPVYDWIVAHIPPDMRDGWKPLP